MDPTRLPPRLRTYAAQLQKLSLRTGTPLTSLALSFAILHELTAIVPLVGIYWGARAWGVGEKMKDYWPDTNVDNTEEGKTNDGLSERSTSQNAGMIKETLARWTKEGERRVTRVGARYGILGFEKGQSVTEQDMQKLGGRVAVEVANGAFAYVVVKVCTLSLAHNVVLMVVILMHRSALTGSLTVAHWRIIVFRTRVLKNDAATSHERL
jgi:hypothetical protein